MSYRGKVEKGVVIPESGTELPEGAQVIIELAPETRSSDSRDSLLRMLDLAGDTGISDLATNVDHYLYGHPKVDESE